MPKLNTFLAATLLASTFAATAYAGEPGYTGSRVHPGYNSSQYSAQSGHVLYGSAQAPTYRTYGSVQTSASSHAQAAASATAYGSYSSAYSSASAHSSYSSAGTSYGAGYGYTGTTTGGPNYVMNTAGPVDIYSDEIICTLHGEEVPCDAIPGLAEALRAQGMNSIADALPAYRGGPAVDYMYDGSYASGYGQTSYAHTGASYQSSAYASASSSSYAAAGYNQQYVPTHQSGSYYQGQQEVWVTPCGQVITTVSGHIPPCNTPVYYEPAPEPVTVRLTDGTVFALFGGVGSGVHGEYYGGGGTYIEGGATYSGVLNHAASNYTFRRRTREHNPPSNPPHNPPCGGGGGSCGGGGGNHGGGGHNGGGCGVGGGCGGGGSHGGGHNGGGYHGGGHNGGGYNGGGRGHGGRGGGGHNGGNHGGGGSCGGGC